MRFRFWKKSGSQRASGNTIYLDDKFRITIMRILEGDNKDDFILEIVREHDFEFEIPISKVDMSQLSFLTSKALSSDYGVDKENE